MASARTPLTMIEILIIKRRTNWRSAPRVHSAFCDVYQRWRGQASPEHLNLEAPLYDHGQEN